jgi:flagellar basal-body rod modification protein FlgD
MTINTELSPQELSQLNMKVDGFNKKIKADNQGSKNSLDEADFMKLLITQLKTQDPTKPLDDKEFIGQMAQFTSLKQMNALGDSFKTLSKEFSFTKAVNLVNKWVSWTDEGGRLNSGVVESVKVREGNTMLNIDNNDVPLEQIQEVRDVAVQAKEPVKYTDAALNIQSAAPVKQDEFILNEPKESAAVQKTEAK